MIGGPTSRGDFTHEGAIPMSDKMLNAMATTATLPRTKNERILFGPF